MKIGITLDFSIAMWSNGMQQNVVFLYELLERGGHDCYYITDKDPVEGLSKQHKGMYLFDILQDDTESFDVLIIAGFDLLPDMYEKLLSRNKEMQIICIHYGNKMFDDMHKSLTPGHNTSTPILPPKNISQVWTSPHYSFAIPYLKEYYQTDKVYECPYIWDSFFLQEEMKKLKKKGLDPHFRAEDINKVCVFEPNKTLSKNCLLPVATCSRVESLFPGTIESLNVYCTEGLRKNKFFGMLANTFPIIGEKKHNTFFNNRWGSLDALSRHGSCVLSHQINNSLNYIYFESLYLGIPLIHNSEYLQDVGYYYVGFDIDMAAKQLKNAILNHSLVIDHYIGDAKNFLHKFSPYNSDNIFRYNDLLNNGKPK